MLIRAARLRPLPSRVLKPDQTWRQVSPRSAHKKAPSLAEPEREQVQGASNALLGGRSKGRGVIVRVNRGGIPPGSRAKDVASIHTHAEASAGAGLTAQARRGSISWLEHFPNTLNRVPYSVFCELRGSCDTGPRRLASAWLWPGALQPDYWDCAGLRLLLART